jgi:PPOX class probable F420-dependent enzyme
MWTVLALALVVLGATVGAQFPPDVRQALATAKNLYVATKRKDGSTSKVSPIWFMTDGEAVYFTTTPTSYKAKRIANGSPVLVWVGSEQGPHFVGKGEILRDPAVAEKMAPAYDQKYWISWLGFFRPRPGRVREGKTLIVKVTPLPPGA